MLCYFEEEKGRGQGTQVSPAGGKGVEIVSLIPEGQSCWQLNLTPVKPISDL